MTCTLIVYEQLHTLVHQCAHIEVTATILKDITFKTAQFNIDLQCICS